MLFYCVGGDDRTRTRTTFQSLTSKDSVSTYYIPPHPHLVQLGGIEPPSLGLQPSAKTTSAIVA